MQDAGNHKNKNNSDLDEDSTDILKLKIYCQFVHRCHHFCDIESKKC